ncbi:hypothetical protein SDC9_150824 [bioreactor metagenome]|uniref:HD-GYP domain-containing protein n=1 Tax=bioreactor metagenome TaxID=1076179 RepID=A0A645ESV1_9ZZZZ
MEFYHILKGELTIIKKDGEVQIKEGESFYMTDFCEEFSVKCQNDVKMLCITEKPMFDSLCDYLDDLDELLRKVDEKDRYTYGHGKRVMEYAVKIARKMGISSSAYDNIAVSSLFHDVGKCYIPDEILNKPTRLTDMEFKAIMKHPLHTGILLERKFGWDVAEIAQCHHERIDGKGYPFGLRGDEIRIESKIIAVCDAFDAMTTDRPYRKAMTPQQAIEELERCIGINYDKNVVIAFIKLYQSKEI